MMYFSLRTGDVCMDVEVFITSSWGLTCRMAALATFFCIALLLIGDWARRHPISA